jgi:hypothetical protein
VAATIVDAVDAVDPLVARRTWRTLEPIHGMIYFAPEAAERYAGLGLRGRMGYFASRAAALGPVPAEAVIALFFNFEPGLVRRAIPVAWDLATPADVLAARTDAADAALRRAFGGAIAAPELAEASGLARRAAEAACERPEGRPLFAAHASLPWPPSDAPHLVLWHAQTLLREFRGDAHVAGLLVEGLSGVEALVSHAASGDVPAEVLRASRAWPPEAWAAAVDALRSRGLLTGDDEPTFTDAGREQRRRVEDRTDALSAAAYAPLGEDGCARLRRLARPYSRAVVDGGLLAGGAGSDDT